MVEMSIDPPRNFKISLEDRVRAMAAGPPAYAVRKRRIEDALARYDRTLGDVRDALRMAGATDERVAQKVRERARRLDLAATNKLIDAHNRYYPIEANLPIDPASGEYLLLGEIWTMEPRVTVDSVVRAVLEAEAPESSAKSARPFGQPID
jgi:hypothetical protein